MIRDKRATHRGLSLGVALSMAWFTFASTPIQAKTHQIKIENMKFVPDVLEVRSGDTVVWNNTDIVPHTATAHETKGKKSAFDSGMITTGQSYAFRTSSTGEISYVCLYHPTMTAKIVVLKAPTGSITRGK